MSKVNYYAYKDGELYYTGSLDEVAFILDYSCSVIRNHYVKKTPLGKEGYTFKTDESIALERKEYESVKEHLKRYGNTNVVEEPTEIIKRLKAEGINVSVKHYKSDDDLKEDWILKKEN